MKLIFILVTLLSSFCIVSGQEFSKWQELKVDLAAPADAISILGKASKEQTRTLAATKQTATTKGQPERKIKELFFKKQEKFDELVLSFYENRLFAIKLVPQKKKIFANELPKLFSRDFLFAENFAKNTALADFEGQKETSVPKIYPRFYTMLSVSPDISVIATINNDTWKTVWRDAFEKPTVEPFPGYAEQIMILSRNWEQ